jgi:phage terminase small subunit
VRVTARVIGAQNLSKLNIAAAIEKARTKRAERTELTQDWVVEELRKIAGANFLDDAATPFLQTRDDRFYPLAREKQMLQRVAH